MHNPKDKNPSMPYVLLLSTNLLAKGMEIVRGERTSRIKTINPKSCLKQAHEIMINLESHEHTRYFTLDEFREVKKEFRIK